MTISLNVRERAVLAHVVADPDAWIAHAAVEFGEERARAALDAKVARWAPVYDAAVAADGEAYLSRALREV